MNEQPYRRDFAHRRPPSEWMGRPERIATTLADPISRAERLLALLADVALVEVEIDPTVLAIVDAAVGELRDTLQLLDDLERSRLDRDPFRDLARAVVESHNAEDGQ